MHEFRLTIPTKAHEQQAREFFNEFLIADGSQGKDVSVMEQIRNDYDGWLAKLDRERPHRATFFTQKGERIVGLVRIHFAQNGVLIYRGGHIATAIRPSERGQGYNKISLFLALQTCKQRGCENALLTCSDENTGLAKTIESFGGKLVSKYGHQSATHARTIVQVYSVDIDAALDAHSAEYAPRLAEAIVQSCSA